MASGDMSEGSYCSRKSIARMVLEVEELGGDSREAIISGYF